MASADNPATLSGLAPTAAAAGARGRVATLIRRPVVLFVVLSTLFGVPAVFLNPPLRGADEPAHFLRIYGISRGEVIPSLTDEKGRRGILLPAGLNADYQFFEALRYRFRSGDFRYRQVFAEYARRTHESNAAAPTFVLYAGSEAYSPLAYLPYVPAAVIARFLGLDFVPMLWLMRLAGLAAMTAVVAYAIALVPYLKWTFLCIAMLPIALYERVVVSPDGAALGFAMVVTALCLRAAEPGEGGAARRALWMTLCVVVKPSQVPFILMETMTRPVGDLVRHWRTAVAITAPGVMLTLLWLFANSADMGAWRMMEGTGAPPEQFNIGWKLGFLVHHPGHFLSAAAVTLAGAYDLWRETIGALGWRDIHLALPTYLALTALLAASAMVRLELDAQTRRRVATVAGLTVLSYGVTIFLIFYLAWTPIDATFVHGVQGRYFTVVLPAAAVAIAALLTRAPPRWIAAMLATVGAIVSSVAMLDAIVRSQW